MDFTPNSSIIENIIYVIKIFSNPTQIEILLY